MNVPFVTGNEELDAKFVAEAKAAGLENLKGHRTVGGMRASIYNAMPIEGVKALVEFMDKFEKENMYCLLYTSPGDGIGPEIVTEAQKVLNAVGEKFGHSFQYMEVDMGGISIDKYGVPLTEDALCLLYTSRCV